MVEIAAGHVVKVLALKQALVDACHLHNGHALFLQRQHCGLVGRLGLVSFGNFGVRQRRRDQHDLAVGIRGFHLCHDGGEICREIRGAEIARAVVHAEGNDQ